MNSKQKTNWWIDVFLFISFITTYFLNLSGVELHQWIGILCGTLAAYHLYLHRDWVEAVTQRFLVKTSSQARIYYVLDVLLLLGFIFIGVTGLVISTWLNLSLSNFTIWLNIHITISIATLVTLLLKLAVHWRWIVHTARKIWTRPVMAPEKNVAVRPVRVSSGGMGRREFLQVMGAVGAASFLALANASKALVDTVATTEATITEEVATLTGSTSTVNTSSQPSLASSDSSCTVSCRKGCSYPGHCHRYVDTNNNNLCDLGECV